MLSPDTALQYVVFWSIKGVLLHCKTRQNAMQEGAFCIALAFSLLWQPAVTV